MRHLFRWKHGMSKDMLGNFFLVIFFAMLIILGLAVGLQHFYTEVLLNQIALTEFESVLLIENDYQSLSHNLTNISYQLANDEDVSEVFSFRSENLSFANLQKLTKVLSQHVRAIPYVDSIYILNLQGKSVYFSTTTLTQAIEFSNEDLSDQQIFYYLENFENYRYQLPINRSIDISSEVFGSSAAKNLMTYIYSPQPINTKSLKHAVVINVSADQLGRHLKELSPSAVTVILDENEIIASSNTIERDSEMYTQVVSFRNAVQNDVSFEIVSISGQKWLAVYKQIGTTSKWCVKLISYQYVTSRLVAARQGVFVICLLVLGVSLLLSIAVSFRINAPVMKLQRKYEALKQDEQMQLDFLQREYIKYLLSDKNFVTSDLYVKKLHDLQFNVDFSKPCVLLNFVFDARDEEIKLFYEKEKRLDHILRYAIERQFASYTCEICTMSMWQHVVIIQIKSSQNMWERLERQYHEFQFLIEKELPFDVSVSAAEVMPPQSTLFQTYEHTNNLLNYRISFGCGHFLTDQKLECVKGTEYEAFRKKKQELFELAFHSEKFDLRKLKAKYHELIDAIMYFCYEDFTSCIIDLALELMGILERYTQRHRVQLQLENFNLMIRRAKTIHQVDGAFYFLFSLLDTLPSSSDRKVAARMDAVCEYIDGHYMEQDLSVNSISLHFRISASYLGQLFATYYQQSLPNYISDVRISHSKQLLQNTQQPIAEISSQVGFSSHKYFCKVFKEATGVTPKEYRQRMNNQPQDG